MPFTTTRPRGALRRLAPITLLVILALAIGARTPAASAAAAPADLGDAPDSDNNHAGIANTAYPGVPGHFPTVWNSGTPAPSGPRHANTDRTWLGASVTGEDEADTGADADGKNNILAGGADNANNDGGDDGWLNQSSALIGDCRESTLSVRVSKNLNAQPPTGRMFLNVWFDGNRDGDWADQRACPGGQSVTSEWIVRNFVIDTSTFAAPSQDFTIPTMLVLNAAPSAPAWVRFSLSEQPAPTADGGIADGRGPAAPNSYAEGETEDYLFTPPAPGQGEPGPITISKATSASGTPGLNAVLGYTIDIANTGAAGSPAALAVMSDTLSPNVQLVSGPSVSEIAPGASPLVAYFDAGAGPRGTIGWKGALAPQAKLRVSFQVKLTQCPDGQPNRVIHNVARAQQLNRAPIQSADIQVPVSCQPPPTGQITLEKRIVAENNGQPALVIDRGILPGQEATYMLTLATTNVSHTVHISDVLPLGLQGIDAAAERGEAHIVGDGGTATWDGTVAPGAPVHVKLRVRLTGDVRCEDQLVNTARWYTSNEQGQSNATMLRLACHDLGDAPDSSNHFNTMPIMAYPGVPGQFPTVFNSAAPRGPEHLIAGPLRLGTAVTAEDEADVGFDSDGAHNLEPASGAADLDKGDDGLARDKVQFGNCATAQLPIKVSVDPQASGWLTATSGIAYLNVWLDSNRDGDWADSFECPAASGNGPALAREHIVIDMPIDTTKIAGTQDLLASTSGPVAWPQQLAGKPAWLRVTLSDRPANKVLPAGCTGLACSYGDGRGYDQPFRLGETEDYLLVSRGESAPADPAVEKSGSIFPEFRSDGPNGDTPIWRISWRIGYQNRGAGAAGGVALTDTLSGPQTRGEVLAVPNLPHNDAGAITSFALGDLGPGQAGVIVLQTSAPITTPPGTILSNTVTIQSASDSNTANNTAVASVTVPLLPPVIVYPTPGTTCETTISISGRAQPGAAVDVYVDGALLGSQTASNAGVWSQPATLANGAHDIYAVARLGGVASQPSPTATVMVDSTLGWSPLSLRFTDDGGRAFIPRDKSGRTDQDGWNVFLRAHTTYTVTVKLCCTDPSATVTLDVPTAGTVSLADPDNNHVFQTTFTTGDRAELGSSSLRICVTCNLVRRCSDGQVLIDPEGVVYDARLGPTAGKLAGATVTCSQAQTSASGATSFGLWPASDFGQTNPQTTAANGFFSFYTPPGTYRLEASKAGYQPYRSRDIVVSNTPVEYNIALTPKIAGSATVTVTVGPNGFEPPVVKVRPGTVIVWVNTDTQGHTITGSGASAQSARDVQQDGGGANSWDSGLLAAGATYKRQVSGSGTFGYADAENPTNSATIVSDGRVFVPVASR